MARGRSSKGNANTKKPKPLKRSDGTLKQWNTANDIPMDEEDQFHASRDKILLEGDSYGGEDDGDDDEVFALKGLDDESEDEGEEYEQEDMEGEELEEEAPKSIKKAKKTKGKGKAVESSDEEGEEEEEGWGRGRAAYYSSNAVQLESDDEEGNELEEQEAKRLQAKIREEMKDDDFGLNDNPGLESLEDAETSEEPTPSILPTLPTGKDLLRHLEKTNPESLALARDWDDIAPKLEKTRERIAQIEADDPGALSLGMIHLYYQALLSYSTMLAFYLHLRANSKYAQQPTLLRNHPILQRLLVLKQSLSTLEDLDFAVSDSEDYDDEFMDLDLDEADILADGESVWALDRYQGLEPNELHDLLDDAEASLEQSLPPTPVAKASKPPKKKRKIVDSKPESTVPVFDLVEPEFVSSRPSPSRARVDGGLGDAYGEATALNETDAADKIARKKSLRFHTQKIESASARRAGARNQAAGGDDDIPYRERKKEKEAKLVREAAKRSNEQGGADLDDVEPEPQGGNKRSRGNDEDDNSGNEDPDDYYELVKNKSKQKKEKKKAEYEEAHGRTRLPLEDDDSSGPRSLTRAILTNKGLTPHRPKSVRNPRVKKRQKFEKAKKKISSQKAVYKGGLAETGRYDGERSGISQVVKSVRLG